MEKVAPEIFHKIEYGTPPPQKKKNNNNNSLVTRLKNDCKILSCRTGHLHGIGPLSIHGLC